MSYTPDIFGKVRTCQVNDQIMFVGKDVATALGYSNTRDALNKHVDNEDKGTVAIRDTAYETRAVFINESGLYSLILSSKLPQAKAFKRWVTSEVLPSIRKTGRYELPQQIPALAMLNEEAEDTLKGEKKVLTEKPTEPTEKPTEPTEKPTEVYDVVSYTHWMN